MCDRLKGNLSRCFAIGYLNRWRVRACKQQQSIAARPALSASIHTHTHTLRTHWDVCADLIYSLRIVFELYRLFVLPLHSRSPSNQPTERTAHTHTQRCMCVCVCQCTEPRVFSMFFSMFSHVYALNALWPDSNDVSQHLHVNTDTNLNAFIHSHSESHSIWCVLSLD